MPVNRDRALAVMREHRLDAIISMTPENMTYLTDFPMLHGCLAETKVYVVFPAAGDQQPGMVIPRNSVDMLTSSASTVEDIWLHGNFFLFESEGLKPEALTAEERRLHTALRRPHQQGDHEALLACLKAKGLEAGRIGFDEKSLASPEVFDQIEALLPKAEVVPAYKILRKIRMVKTAEELRRMRVAAAANQAGAQAVFDAARVGIRELDLAPAYYGAIGKGGALPHHLCINCGRRAGFPNGEPSEYRLQAGDVIRFDADCFHHYYFSDIARNAVVGSPSPKLKTYHGAVVAGLEAAASAMRPGAKASDIFRASVDAVRRAGISHFDRHHVGHAIGVVCYDDPLIGPNDYTMLEEGMVINIENPYYEVGFGGAHVENTFRITKAGCEPLQSMSLALQTVG
jgi:Xaa-Pro aminopeptidase